MRRATFETGLIHHNVRYLSERKIFEALEIRKHSTDMNGSIRSISHIMSLKHILIIRYSNFFLFAIYTDVNNFSPPKKP